MRTLLALSLVLATGFLATGCDSSDDTAVRLDAAYYVGSWSFVSASDASGNRTPQVLTVIDDLNATFRSDDTFTLAVDLNRIVNAAGQPDVNLAGTYQATVTPSVLVLNAGGVAPLLTTTASTRTRVSLTAPSAVISQLLGAGGLSIPFQGDVTLVIQRR